MQSTALSTFSGRPFVHGEAEGDILASATELSFWGGVDPATGEVIDRYHPLSGQRLAGKILALPGGRGSCSGSGVMLEMLVNGMGPAAILIARPDDIITLGVLVAKEIFARAIPVVMLNAEDFQRVLTQKQAVINGGEIICSDGPVDVRARTNRLKGNGRPMDGITLSPEDEARLAGQQGRAPQVAMKILLQMAQIMGAHEFMDVTQVHIDGCVYTGPASLSFAKALREMGGRVAVPTSLNAISVDYRHWRADGIPSDFGEKASALADAYTDMGARPTFTCAPYLLESAPQTGEQIAWAESNAVVFANSVLGARTMKYPDYLDVCIALTGRAPRAGVHLDQHRKAELLVKVEHSGTVDDLFYPLLGYQVGRLAGHRIAAIDGLADLAPDHDDLKAFGAAYATLSSAPMFHIIGVTPDAPDKAHALSAHAPLETRTLRVAELAESWSALNAEAQERVDLVSLGNPHFSLREFAKLADLCKGQHRHDNVAIIITTGRETLEKAREAGYVDPISAFGAKIVTDTCWCMLGEPVIAPAVQTILTNSAKYAHYGPGITGRKVRLASLENCIRAARQGRASVKRPGWMANDSAKA